MTSLDLSDRRLVTLPTVKLPLEPGEDACPDCDGALVVIDDDGSVSGVVGGLIDCICVACSPPPGFEACGACGLLVHVDDPSLAVYLGFCEGAGMEPAWCLRCGTYLALCNGTRPRCGCGGGGRAA